MCLAKSTPTDPTHHQLSSAKTRLDVTGTDDAPKELLHLARSFFHGIRACEPAVEGHFDVTEDVGSVTCRECLKEMISSAGTCGQLILAKTRLDAIGTVHDAAWEEKQEHRQKEQKQLDCMRKIVMDGLSRAFEEADVCHQGTVMSYNPDTKTATVQRLNESQKVEEPSHAGGGVGPKPPGLCGAGRTPAARVFGDPDAEKEERTG